MAAMIQESEQRMMNQMEQMGKVLEMVAVLNQKQDERLTRLDENVSGLKEDVSELKDSVFRLEESVSGLTDITRAWIYKGNLIEKEVQELKRRMGDE
ncbi:hypothetical protein [Laceyella putida]|uniref:Uncharacterized protein n=1 Tax=Laceyella putida TaxID=110101 RepID=A0ABW2RFN6_9BACL